MCLSALVDAGVPLDYLTSQLQQLALAEPYQLSRHTITHNGQVATHIDVTVPSTTPHTTRHLPEITALIENAHLPPRVKQWSQQVFQTLALAEGEVHGISPDQVHFHEVGATDAIIDIVGTCLGLDWLGVEQIYCSSLPMGGGTVKAAHGRLPVPVPAVVKLWQSRNVPVYENDINQELVTPTGAALAVSLAQAFATFPAMTVQTVGFGAGTAHLPLPNILRLWVGETTAHNQPLETVAVLQTQIDDLSAQVVAYCQALLFQAGALDVFTQPIAMKKSRLGTLMTVICPLDHIQTCETILFRETSTLGIRRQIQNRTALTRDIQSVETPLGVVRVKVALLGNQVVNIQPEYEDCVKIAQQQQKPLKQVQDLVIAHYQGIA